LWGIPTVSEKGLQRSTAYEKLEGSVRKERTGDVAPVLDQEA
jgi:hypothetical protein